MLKRHNKIKELSESETRKILGEMNDQFSQNVNQNYFKMVEDGYFDLVFNAHEDDPYINSKNLLNLLNIIY